MIYRNDGRQVLHLGGSYLHRSYEDELEFGLEPEVHKTDDFVAGTILDVEHSNSFGLELAGVLGPAHLQGEYAQMDISRTTGKDPDVDSWYVQGGVFLTGEIRPYDKGDGDFGRVKPNSPFTGLGTGPGAWELAARYSTIDFTDVQDLAPAGFTPAFGTTEQAASEVDVYTLGLNWYPVAPRAGCSTSCRPTKTPSATRPTSRPGSRWTSDRRSAKDARSQRLSSRRAAGTPFARVGAVRSTDGGYQHGRIRRRLRPCRDSAGRREVRRIRDAYASKHNHDFRRLVADLEARQRRSRRPLVDRRQPHAGTGTCRL